MVKKSEPLSELASTFILSLIVYPNQLWHWNFSTGWIKNNFGFKAFFRVDPSTMITECYRKHYAFSSCMFILQVCIYSFC